jgi:putative secretion ATPase (PEP-CTERM system associated)
MFDDFYGLKGRPFQITPDAAYFFESGTHRKALSYLGYGLDQGEGFIVITGEVGAGKSTLVAHLMDKIDRARLTAAQVVTTALGGEELVHVVARSFGLAIQGHDKATALGAIEGFLHQEAREGRRCLLIVDEAQNLSIAALEELRMMSNFQLGARPLLQVLLLGQPEFRTLIHDSPELEQLRQRIIATYHLAAMEPGEIRPYVEHRLKCAGWQNHPTLDVDLFAELYAASGGLPRRINRLFNRILQLGAVEQLAHIDAAILHKVVAEMGDGGVASAPRRPAERPASFASPGLVDDGNIANALAARDAQIAELQQAMIDLTSRTREMATAQAERIEDEAPAALTKRVADLEERLFEQELLVRHTLSMMIEWLESEELRAAA